MADDDSDHDRIIKLESKVERNSEDIKWGKRIGFVAAAGMAKYLWDKISGVLP